MRHSHRYGQGSCWEPGRWDHVGHAAERFARRVARDAGKFAERVQEHAGDFAHDLASHGRRWRDDATTSFDRAARPDVRQIFEDIREVVSGIAEEVDELIDRIFPQETQRGTAEWTKVVTNRSGNCSKCGIRSHHRRRVLRERRGRYPRAALSDLRSGRSRGSGLKLPMPPGLLVV